MLTGFDICKEAQRQLHKESGDIAFARNVEISIEDPDKPVMVIRTGQKYCAFHFKASDLSLTLSEFAKRYLHPVAVVLWHNRVQAAA